MGISIIYGRNLRGHLVLETKKTLFGYGKPKEKAMFNIKNQVPSQIPPIYDGNRLVLYKQLDKNYNVGDEITIKAKTVVGDLEHTFKVTSDSFIEGKSLHQLFARKMIQEIEEKNVIDNQNESKALILELGLKYNLASKYTSFVGVDSKQNITHSIFMETRNVKNQIPFGYQMKVRAFSAPKPMMSKKKCRYSLGRVSKSRFSYD